MDQIDELEIRKLYGTKWRGNRCLLRGLMKPRCFFRILARMENGVGLQPRIKTPDGDMVAAIETIWDKTEDRKAEKKRKRIQGNLPPTVQSMQRSPFR